MGKLRIHKGCGGAIRNNKCTKCQKEFGKMARLIGSYYEDIEEPFDVKGYKQRIRRGDDIFK